MAVNAEKHGGFFWWMDKNEEGTTLITAPEEGSGDSERSIVDIYYIIDNVPEKYKEYAIIPTQIESAVDYDLKLIEITKLKDSDTVYELFQNKKSEQIRFWIKIYPQQILRVREAYPGYTFLEEFEDNGIEFDIFLKDEYEIDDSYIIHFYYGKEKYIIGGNDKEILRKLALEYRNAVVNSNAEY